MPCKAVHLASKLQHDLAHTPILLGIVSHAFLCLAICSPFPVEGTAYEGLTYPKSGYVKNVPLPCEHMHACWVSWYELFDSRTANCTYLHEWHCACL